MDLIAHLYWVGIAQGIILAGGLSIARTDHRQANFFMAALVIAISLKLVHDELLFNQYFFENPAGALTVLPLSLAWGPCLYLYAYSITNRRVYWRQAVHFVPALLFLGVAISFLSYSSEEQLAAVNFFWREISDETLRRQYAELLPSSMVIWKEINLHGNLFAVQFGTYCLLVLREIRRHNRRLQHHFSYLEDMNLRWLKVLTIACLVFLLLFVVFNRTHALSTSYSAINAIPRNIPYIFLVILIYIIGAAAIFQSSLAKGVKAAQDSAPVQDRVPPAEAPGSPVSETAAHSAPSGTQAPSDVTTAEKPDLSPTILPTDDANRKKYERSGLSVAEAERIKMLLMTKIQEEELFLDSDLTLPVFAERAGVSTNQASQVINGQLNQNFFSFVSHYRIQRAKELMSDPQTSGMPIVELAVEVGFKSKSSFYKVFKATTGMTPTQYKKSLKLS